MHSNADAPVIPKAVAQGLIARQPILDVNRKVVAYELFDRSTAPNAYDVESDIFLSFSAMNHIGEDMLPGPMLIFINRTHQSLIWANNLVNVA